MQRGTWRTLLVSAAAALLLPAALIQPASAAPSGADSARIAAWEKQFGVQQVAKQLIRKSSASAGANPLVALPADPGQVDQAYWRKVNKARAVTREAARVAARTRVAAQPLLVDEAEPDTLRGLNDTQRSAEYIPGFGTARGKNPAARILGTLAPAATPASFTTTEDNGSIPLATTTGLVGPSRSVRTSTQIGDGPHGSAGTGTGDFDFYEIAGVRAGQSISVDTDTPTSTLDTIVVVWDAAGTPLALNDDDGTSFDSRLTFVAPADGDYYVSTSGYPQAFPDDPFDSGSGDGAGSEGGYDITLGVDASDVDYFSVDLRPGDVVGASVTGAATRLALFEPDGTEVIGSTQDASFIYPADSPLPGGGNAVLAHVADRNGRYALRISDGAGNYDTTLEVYRPGLQRQSGPVVQTLFVDFDGARVNTAIFGGPGVRTLSPLRGFLGGWGLGADDENAVIDATMRRVRENVRADLAARGGNPNFGVRILNSRDHADPFGQPNVSRLIVGGTIDESGINTIGIAQSIDPGNYETEETALILLDILSGPAAEFGDASINFYLRPQSDVIDFVGQVLGNITSHEAGHYLGNFHVDQFNTVPNLMDQGGNFPILYGVGPDGIGGTPDDIDVDFGVDVLNPNEGFSGFEDTLTTTAWGLFRRQA